MRPSATTGRGSARLVYPMAGLQLNDSSFPRTLAATTGTFLDVEWHYDAAAGTTQFAWQQVYDVGLGRVEPHQQRLI